MFYYAQVVKLGTSWDTVMSVILQIKSCSTEFKTLLIVWMGYAFSEKSDKESISSSSFAVLKHEESFQKSFIIERILNELKPISKLSK